jgi:hypothetical protein
LEHRSRQLLEADGFTVLRAAASKGDFDLGGYSPAGWVLCQVKASRPPGPMERRGPGGSPLPAGLRPPDPRLEAPGPARPEVVEP